MTFVCHDCRDAAAGEPGSKHCDATGGPGARCDCSHRSVPQPTRGA